MAGDLRQFISAGDLRCVIMAGDLRHIIIAGDLSPIYTPVITRHHPSSSRCRTRGFAFFLAVQALNSNRADRVLWGGSRTKEPKPRELRELRVRFAVLAAAPCYLLLAKRRRKIKDPPPPPPPPTDKGHSKKKVTGPYVVGWFLGGGPRGPKKCQCQYQYWGWSGFFPRFFVVLLTGRYKALSSFFVFFKGRPNKKQKNKGESVGCFCVGLRFFGLFLPIL
jgi:hypothetical protein